MAKKPKKQNQRTVDMAATLFAELFYRQVMMEREAKSKEKKLKKKIDNEQSKDVKVIHG